MERKNESVEKLLMQRAEQVRYASDIIFQKTRDWQLIKEFMSNRNSEIELTPEQEKKLNRYKFIYDQLSSGKYTKSQIIGQLTNKSLYNLSMRQAYEDIKISAELFYSISPFKKQYEVANEIEVARSARQQALSIHDYKAAAALTRVIKDLIAMQPEDDDSAGDLFEGHTIEATFDPSLLGAPKVDMKELLELINKNRKVPVNIDMFEHLDFEESGSKENSL